MKVWAVTYMCDEDAKIDGVEDEAFAYVYKRLEKAKEECETHLKQSFPEMDDHSIEWVETTSRGAKFRRFLGRPKSDTDGAFDVYQVEVVN